MQSLTLLVVLAGLSQCNGQNQGPTSLTEVFQMKDDFKKAKSDEFANAMLQWKSDMDAHRVRIMESRKGISTLQISGVDQKSSARSPAEKASGQRAAAEANANGQQYVAEEEAEDDLLRAAARLAPASTPAAPAALVNVGHNEVVMDQKAKASAIPQAALKDLKATPVSRVTAPQVVLAAAVTGDGAVASVNGEGSALMDASSLLLEVRGQSGRAVAEKFSLQAEEVLARRAANEDEAARLEERARGLRRDAAELMASVPQVVADASRLVVQEESRQGFAEASALNEQAEETELEANRARGEALDAMEAAKHAQGSVMGDIQQLRAPAPQRGM